MTSDVLGAFLTYLPTYPNQILYCLSLFSKIRCNTYLTTYLPINLMSYVNDPNEKNKTSNFIFLEMAEHILLKQLDRFQTSIVTVISITSLSTIR